ncbi:MAG TPA: peptide ABC transporter substrate-binding protein [Candidatus Saccharimonadales bacterium]|jgi:peptide/nickel transport system substrate-binding protein|nr:peptide ABC transporter substrate-binding protein [Candidatus Saccharimonadales bacterium]
MLSRTFKLRFRRLLRLRKRQVENLGLQAEEGLERNFFRRLDRLVTVRRFVITWVLLVVLLGGCMVAQLRVLNGAYQTLQPAPGGTYSEGVLGSFTNANPIYATSPVDAAVSHLIFAGLFTYNEQNQFVGDLAKDQIDINDRGNVYTVHLKPHLTWQDGQPLTADDVAFTYHTIQNADAQSPLNSSWAGVTVTATDVRTITFTLPNALSSFKYSLTNGIIPEHILKDVSMPELRSSSFNTSKPVGAGPFAWQAIEVGTGDINTRDEQIALKPFVQYHGGAPKLNSFIIHAFPDENTMVKSFRKQELTAMSGLTTVPSTLKKDSNVVVNNFPLNAEVMTFFKTTQGVLADTKVRQALVQAADRNAIISELGYPTRAVTEPFLQGQLGFNKNDEQPTYNPTAAAAALDADGWKVGANGIRTKDGQPLTFKLYAQDNGEYGMVAKALSGQWRKVGVDAQVVLQNGGDFQNTLAFHSYDALLYGISVGIDPDVFVYWDSSQGDIRAANRLNFSEYKSTTSDASLEAGRTRSDPALRVIKYQAFLQAWQSDAPALGLYQPRYLYITHGQVAGLNEHTLTDDTDRYDNVQNWMIRRVWSDTDK